MSAHATIRTAIVVETLPRGRWLAWPFADPELTQLGRPEDDPLLIMSLALPEHLKSLAGSDIARYATPAGTRLRTTPVALERADRLDRPARLVRAPERFTMLVPWLVTPYGKELWLHIPPLKLTLRADVDGKDADLDVEVPALVASEVRRVVAATEPSPEELLKLFPALRYRLEWIDIALENDSTRGRSSSAKTAAKMIEQEEAHGLLLTVASPVHADARVLEGAPLVGRPGELETLDRLLAKHSVLVHGPELAGKTALIEGWLRARLASPEPRDPKALPPVLVYATSGARLMAGMSMLGQWQERLKRVLSATASLSGVLWIEHLGELVGEAGHGEELANALRPWLEDGRVRVVTELRDDEVDRLERRYPALLAVLRRVRLAPLEAPATLHVLAARREHMRIQEPDRPGFDPSALPEVIALAGRYQSHLALPGSAVRLGEDLRSLADAERTADGRVLVIDRALLQRLYASLTGLPLWLLDDAKSFDLDATRAILERQVIGQDAAVRAVAESLAVIKTRLAARGKPLASFLFAGPTGVGKTELARALAIHLFGSEQRLVRFDMSEFMDASAAERLIRGGDGQKDGLLTRRLRREPLSIVLLDEIEKAHQSVFDLLLQALGEGRLTDAAGRTASLEGAIVILTSNLGSADKVKRIGISDGSGAAESLAAHYLAAVRKHFAPEMVNRIERIIPFASLGAEPLRKITRLQVERVRKRRGLTQIELVVSDAALDQIAIAGTTAEYGARALRRAIDRLLVTPLAHAIAGQPMDKVACIAVDFVDGAIAFTLTERTKVVATHPLMQLGRLRREARGFMRSASVREVKDRLEQLDADLMRGAPPGPLLAERARLDGLLAPFRSMTEDLEQLEDLFYMDRRATGGTGATRPEIEAEYLWAEARMNDLGPAAFEVLTAIEPRRDHALLALTELDEERAFDRWLVPLIEEAEARRWTLHAWIEGERGERSNRSESDSANASGADGAARWPYYVGFGPPRTATELYLRLEERPTAFSHLLLGVSGRNAGTLLACEAGLMAFRPQGDSHAHLLVKVLSTMRSTITPEGLRDSELLSAPPFGSRTSLSHGTPARLFHAGPDRIVASTLGMTNEVPGDVVAWFKRWEQHAARHIRTYDDNLEHDRTEVFESPFDDEQLIKRLMRDAIADRDGELQGGRS